MNALKCTGIFAASGLLLLATSGCGSPNDRSDVRSPAKQSSEADNTERNAEGGATALDQGGSEADRTVTQQIRQAIMDESDFSVNAKNVKIITRDGKVTLRGPVKAADERSRIEAIAERIAGAGNVNNQLELETSRN